MTPHCNVLKRRYGEGSTDILRYWHTYYKLDQKKIHIYNSKLIRHATSKP